MQTLKEFIDVSDANLDFSVYQNDAKNIHLVWTTKQGKEIPTDALFRKIEKISIDNQTGELFVLIGDIVKIKENSSNAKYYSCPLCARMIPEETRRLDICKNCKAGNKFVLRKISKIAK